GRYRVDALVDGHIRRFGFTWPNRFEIVPDEPAPRVSAGQVVDPSVTDTTGLPDGLFVTANGMTTMVPSVGGPRMTEAEAWLDVDPGTGQAPRPRVGSVYLPEASGLGIRLPTGSVV